jgi:hypothetical protein
MGLAGCVIYRDHTGGAKAEVVAAPLVEGQDVWAFAQVGGVAEWFDPPGNPIGLTSRLAELPVADVRIGHDRQDEATVYDCQTLLEHLIVPAEGDGHNPA